MKFYYKNNFVLQTNDFCIFLPNYLFATAKEGNFTVREVWIITQISQVNGEISSKSDILS